MTQETITPEERRRRLIVALGSARPSHAWTPGTGNHPRPGCKKCPEGSPFKLDMASHPYIIEEEL